MVLNFLPGLGVGYIYQRRWKAYWITGVISIFWFLLVLITQVNIDPSDPAPSQLDQIGFYGALSISLITAIEAGLAVKKAREKIDD